MSNEIPLTGGNVNDGVVRIENTVRRQQTNYSNSIHALLEYLHQNAFTAAPRFLGVDDKGREILSYFEGDADNAHLFWTDDSVLCDAATVLRQFHDLTVNFPFSDHTWCQSDADATKHEVLCHHDFAPYNIICQNNKINGMIDFDLAGPGPRLRDIAYAVYWMVPLSLNAPDMAAFAKQDLEQSSRRLHLFCDTYGIPVGDELLSMISHVLHQMGSYENAIAIVGHKAALHLKTNGHLEHWLKEACTFDSNIDRFRIADNSNG